MASDNIANFVQMYFVLLMPKTLCKSCYIVWLLQLKAKKLKTIRCIFVLSTPSFQFLKYHSTSYKCLTFIFCLISINVLHLNIIYSHRSHCIKYYKLIFQIPCDLICWFYFLGNKEVFKFN